MVSSPLILFSTFVQFFFSWKDILNTQKVVSYTLTHAPDIITAATSNIYGSINSSLSNLENIALGAINKTFPHVEEKYLDFKAPIVQNQQTNGNKYLMNLIMANQYRVVNAFPDDAYNNTGKPDEAGDQQPPPPPTSEGIAVEAMKEIIDSMKTVNGSVGAYLIKEPDIFKLIKTYGKEAFGDVLRAVISGTFKVADTVLKVSNVLLATTIDFLRWAFHWFLGKTIYIPVISEIWRSLTKSDISINNILALFAAIPTTLLSKTICGKTLIPDSMFGVLTSWTQADFEVKDDRGEEEREEEEDIV